MCLFGGKPHPYNNIIDTWLSTTLPNETQDTILFQIAIREENTAAGFLSDRRLSLKKTLSDDMILHHNINKIIIT